MRACAIELRSVAMCSVPGSWMLSVQLVRPVSRRASSLRRIGATDRGAVRALDGLGHADAPFISSAAMATAFTMLW